MELKSDFETFLKEIRPTDPQRRDLITGHTTLRDRLNAYENLKPYLLSDFLQGSYRRATAVRPKGDRRSDVDIIVVTNLDESDFTPEEAMDLFVHFLDDHYKGKWRPQGRSFGIELTYVELDLVITSAPSESQKAYFVNESITSLDDIEAARDWRLNEYWRENHSRFADESIKSLVIAANAAEWKLDPLRIPDRNTDTWESTHPLEQIRWTRDKNAKCGYHFVNVVKAIKWWKLINHEEPKHPKGFPLERIIGECCPDDISSIADGITRTLETIASKYEIYVSLSIKPSLPDYGVPDHDVFKRITAADFATFHAHVMTASKIARNAFDSSDKDESRSLWRELFGNKFPAPSGKNKNGGSGGLIEAGGFIAPTSQSNPDRGRFA